MKFTGERYVPEVEGEIRLEHLHRYLFVLSKMDLSDKIVLDIASGEGYGSNMLAKKAMKVVGIDIAEDTIEYAKKKYQSQNIDFRVGDICKIPLPDKSIDLIVSFETIEHHDQHEVMMGEFKRVLKDGGVLIISSPEKLNYSDIPNGKNEFHVKELYYDEFKSLIHKYFLNTKFYFQRVVTSSLLFIDDNGDNFSVPHFIDEKGEVKSFESKFNLCIASDSILENVSNENSILSDPNNLYKIANSLKVENEKLEIKKSQILKSFSYQLGHVILLPLKLFRKFIRKLK
jgi:ubiquinone/menaquinone biosynthesis C-methylase UbiE